MFFGKRQGLMKFDGEWVRDGEMERVRMVGD